MSTILVQTSSFRQKMKKLFAPTALALVLSACTGSGFFQNPVTESLKNEAYATSEFYINKADQSSALEDKQSYRLLAIRKLIDENKLVEAQNTFAMLNIAQLNEAQRLEYHLLSAQLSAALGNNAQAVTLLRQIATAPFSTSQLLRVYQTQARIAENQRDVLEAVRARSVMDYYLGDSQRRLENNDRIWALLRNANRGMLENARASAGETGLAGWLALINLYNQNMVNPTMIPQALQLWRQQYPNHSAAHLLPTELQNVANFQQTQLSRLALLLPLSGDAKLLGEIIKKGFDDAKGTGGLVNVQVWDTDSAPIETLLTQAAQQGVQTTIGPLLKARVDEMLASPTINQLNVLALNSTPNVRAVAKVCYYGLSPESEAQSAAERLYADGIVNAIVFAPQGDFGQRSADAFAQRWRQLTNRNADVRYYHQPMDATTTLQNSGYAAGSALYALGTAEQLLEIKQGIDSSPMAAQLPIYSSSRSNSPNNGPDFRLTMDGVKFSEIPLLIDGKSAEYKKAAKLADHDFSLMRLYAMGSDAWLIANKFNEFRQIPGYKISGLTGVLSAGTNCNIERQMVWLQYQNGSIVNAY